MKRLLAVLMTVLTAAMTFSACADNGGKNREPVTEAQTIAEMMLREKIKGIFEESFSSHAFKGAAYMVCKGEELYAGGTGKANKKEDTDNSADTVFHIASVTKQFTAAAVLRLCEEGKLSLDDTLSKYYPEYAVGADITVHSLLSMQSGIPDFVRQYDENGDEIKSTSQASVEGVREDNSAEENRDAIRAWILSQKTLFPQGDRYSYSNSNYFLLGEIIEQVTGKTYFDYLKTSFFEPMEMTTAGFDENYAVSGATVAKGYYNTGVVSEIYGYRGVSFGSGDMMESPKDLYKWTVALHGGKVLSDEMYRKMTKKQVSCGDGTYYGYGLMIFDSASGSIYLHNGATPRFFSYVIYSPQRDLFLAVMSNYSSESIFGVVREVSEKSLQEIG